MLFAIATGSHNSWCPKEAITTIYFNGIQVGYIGSKPTQIFLYVDYWTPHFIKANKIWSIRLPTKEPPAVAPTGQVTCKAQ